MDWGNRLAHAGLENKIPFQPLPVSTAGNQKLLIAKMRYGFNGAELGAGTRSCALVPTAKLVLRSCGLAARSVPLSLSIFSSFLCPRRGIIFVCAGTGWSGFGSAQAGKLIISRNEQVKTFLCSKPDYGLAHCIVVRYCKCSTQSKDL